MDDGAIAPDTSLERDGRSLREWLALLVSDDPATRERAAEAIHCIWTALPFPAPALERMDLESLHVAIFRAQATFDESVERALASVGFDTRVFVTELCRRRLARSAGASTASLAEHVVFQALGRALLSAPDAVRELLAEGVGASSVSPLLERLGPEARAFAPDLLRCLERGIARREAARALGSIAGSDPRVVGVLVEWSCDDRPALRESAALALERAGAVVDCRDEIVRRLSAGPLDHVTVRALASVGRDDATVRDRVLAAAARAGSDALRAEALDALQHFTEHAGECVPVLVDALGSFEEFDADWVYQGPVARVAHVLGVLGPCAGAAAAVPLARHLGDGGEFPRSILKALSRMGPAASAALPLVEKYSADEWDEGGLATSVGLPLRCFEDDPVLWTLRILRGTPAAG